MGYDFVFARLTRLPDNFPGDLPDDFDNNIANIGPLNAIAKLLVARRGFRPNGPNGEKEHNYWWDTPDGGSLDVLLTDDGISVDTHAHWCFVLETYECIRELHRDLVIIDPQTGTLHDTRSFEAFVHESYRE